MSGFDIVLGLTVTGLLLQLIGTIWQVIERMRQ
jgi:hypothetical protein